MRIFEECSFLRMITENGALYDIFLSSTPQIPNEEIILYVVIIQLSFRRRAGTTN